MQDEIWHQFGIQNYNYGNVVSVYPVSPTIKFSTLDGGNIF